MPNLKVKGGVTVRNVGLDNFFVSLDGRWKEAFKFRAGFWNSEDYYEDGKIPSRFTANLTVGYSVPETGLKIEASATNLFNTQVPEQLGAPQVGRLVWLSATYSVPNLGL